MAHWFKLIVPLALIFVAAFSLGCTTTPTQTNDVTLSVGYIPNVQFAPLYVGIENGYFEEEGINLTLNHAFGLDLTVLGTSQMQFAWSSGDEIITAAAQEIPVVAVSCIYAKYPVSIAFPTSSGITTPQDLMGKEIGLPGPYGASYFGLIAILRENGMQPTDVIQESIGYTQVEALQQGLVDAVVVYTNNEPQQLRYLGMDVSEFNVYDYADLMSNCMITTPDMVSSDPELVQGVVNAVQKSMQYVIDNPDETFEICKKYVEGLNASEDVEQVQRDVLNATIQLYNNAYTQANGLGMMNPVQWNTTASFLLDIGIILTEMDATELYTNQFVQQYHSG